MPCYVIYWNNVVRNEYNQNDRTVHPIRMLSYVTGDPTSCKAWIFLVGCFVYAVLGGVTGYLQSEVLLAYIIIMAVTRTTATAKQRGGNISYIQSLLDFLVCF